MTTVVVTPPETEGLRERTAGILEIRGAVALFALTMFAGSGLLFLVQPMFARMVLPRLGGSPAVWNTCVLFFQTALLLGYLYAHFSTKWLGARRQAWLHAVVLLLPLLFVPLSAGSGTPAASESPVWWLLGVMAGTIGLPFFVLATTAPLLQRWFATLPLPSAKDPYFLYAASNLGSMLALLAYPFLLEPALGLGTQALAWSAGYVAFAVAIAGCVWLTASRGVDMPGVAVGAAITAAAPLAVGQRGRWVLLAFVPSSLMLGVTLHVSTDIAAVPLLWVLPLALYLLTFVIAFSQRGGRFRAMARLAAPVLVFVCLATLLLKAHTWWFIGLHLIGFFACAMACHQELADRRPDVAHLTEFYLWMSFGGMLGGVFNTVVAPVVFSTVLEYPLILALALFLMPRRSRARQNWPTVLFGYGTLAGCLGLFWIWTLSEEMARAAFGLALGAAAAVLKAQGIAALRTLAFVVIGAIVTTSGTGGSVLFQDRSFFGVMQVIESSDGGHRLLRHGSTMHGREQLPPEGQCRPASYYHPAGPVGDLMRTFGARLTGVGVVGLGTGGMACYGSPSQRWRFYEIDPLVERIARDASLFTHLANAPVGVDVVIGDGRVKLQEATDRRYDLLVIDAFSSDAIPVHLLTREAIEVYASRLKPDGLLAIHISNRYLKLEPVVAALAANAGLAGLAKFDDHVSDDDAAEGKTSSHWTVLSRDREVLRALADVPGWRPLEPAVHRLWTDDYSNILSAWR